MFSNHKRLHWTALAVAVLGAWALTAQNGGDALRRGFENPPDSAKPRVWWHWMNGNITKEGIQADLEWMKRVGIGGFQNFDAALSTPQIVDHRLVYMTPEWKDAFRYAATLADRLGLEMAIAGSPGWSESGGPWVPPAQAMKKVVWSETRVEGGRPFTGALPTPPSTTGLFPTISRAGKRDRARGARTQGDLKRRPLRVRHADRWRSGQDQRASGRGARREGLGPIRIRPPADGSRVHHGGDGRRGTGGRRRWGRVPKHRGGGREPRDRADHLLPGCHGAILSRDVPDIGHRHGDADRFPGGRTGPAHRCPREPLRGESRFCRDARSLRSRHTARCGRGCHPQAGHARSDRQDAARWEAGVDSAARAVGGAADGLFADRLAQQPGVARSHRALSRER